jgi:hypothetical protein
MRYGVVLSVYITDIDMHYMYSLAFCCLIGKENSLQKMNKLYKKLKKKGIGIQYGQCNSRVLVQAIYEIYFCTLGSPDFSCKYLECTV